ncbi:hypothetical protein ABZ369_27345, partial [Streptomyces sp. NPDC005918]|uniref:hypothetical protein n=1 Tax=Streptomyces sp. NPDC005918 TaxID=3155454 RepID=UPI0033E96D04
LAELKTLRAKERIPGNRQHNTLYDGRGGTHRCHRDAALARTALPYGTQVPVVLSLNSMCRPRAARRRAGAEQMIGVK